MAESTRILLVVLVALGTTALAMPASADSVGACIYSYAPPVPSTCDACIQTPDVPGQHECGYVIVW